MKPVSVVSSATVDKSVSSTLLNAGLRKICSIMHVERNNSLVVFLRSMGILWSTHSSSVFSNTCQAVWNGTIRAGLVYMIFEGIYIAIVNTPDSSYTAKRLMWVLLAITFSLQSIALILALFDIGRRLQSPVTPVVVQNLSGGLMSAYLVLTISIIFGVIPFVIGFALRSDEVGLYIILMFANLAAGFILTATMYFIALDCAVANSLLDQLLEQQKLELLTCEQFIMASNEVRHQQSKSERMNDSIVVVAL